MLLCHADLSWAEGGFVGLDIFFVLSGFLITGLIVGEFSRTGRISIRNFYARRAKRLLPMACTVLLVILVGSLMIFSTVRQVDTAGDVLAAALYFVNWHFIAEGVDYFAAQDGLISPVQHYWSLSVEEQYYLIWPLLIVACTALAVRFGRNAKLLIFIAISAVTVLSLVYSIEYTAADPRAGYFSTLTRVWELGAGAILALLLRRGTRLRGLTSNLLVIGGLAAVLVSGYAFSEIDPYPGWRALIPVAGTMAVIIGGSSTVRGVGVRFLSLAPFQYLGKISYAWYLWHWPFIVFAIALFGDLTPAWLVVVTLASWIPAEASHRLIEEPFRRSRYLNLRPGKALATGAVFSVAAVGVAFAVSTDRLELAEAPESRVAGADAIKDKFEIQEEVKEVRPYPTKARADKGIAHKSGCLVLGQTTESPRCRFDEGDSGAKRVVLFGDSHALQYSPALLKIAREKKWNLTVLTRGNCLPADTDFKEYCDRWRRATLDRIEKEEKPDLTVVASSTLDVYSLKRGGRKLSRTESQPLLIDAMTETFKRLKRSSGKVVLIRDQARSPFLPFECVAENPKKLKRCVFEPKRRDDWDFDFKGAQKAGVPVVDPMPVLCRENKCPSVIGNALVYRDTYHLSATYSKTIAGWLGNQLENAG